METDLDSRPYIKAGISIHSTARVETHCVTDYFVYRIISIHSTARVETERNRQASWMVTNFNPLHREGGDFMTWRGDIWACTFQSTPPRGWRRPCNPVTSRYIVISIHSTARVETISMTAIDNVVVISIHSTARVETIRPEQEACRQKYFNPLHREGGDQRMGKCKRMPDYFNPLHREGGDLGSPGLFPSSKLFQSTPPRGWRHYPVTPIL